MKSAILIILSSFFLLSFIFPLESKKEITQITVLLPQITSDTIKKAPPVILVKNDSNVSSPIKLEKLDIDVSIIGNIATTTMKMRFYNDSNSILEGQFYFPLGEGQTVSRFAMDVNGKLREGVIVEKEKGQVVFESVIRRKIDPGLLEWTKGNNFKARVYPIPAKGYKTIVVAYEEELTTNENSFFYLLPLNHKEMVNEFDLKVEVLNQDISPQLHKNELINFTFEKWQENFVAKFSKKDYLPSSSLGISIPTAKAKQFIYTEKVLGKNNQYYYYTTIKPNITTSKSSLPKKIGLIWDASNSASGKNIEKEMDLFNQYFQVNKNVEIQLYILRNKLVKDEKYSISQGNWIKLKQKLISIPFDGASSYNDLDLSNYNADMILISGDGLSNFGMKNNSKNNTPINIICSSITANHSLLKYISANSGGQYINLNTTQTTNAINQLTSKNYQYFGNNNKSSYPSMPTVVNSEISVVGIINGTQDVIFNFGNVKAEEKVTIHIDPSKHLTNTGLIRRVWAQKKLNELDINFEENEEKITALGKEFGIVTRNTSLIVLDRVEDYAEHKIVPPEELLDKYWEIIEESTKAEKEIQEDHFKKVLTAFNEYVSWWETDFDLEKIKKSDLKREEELHNRERLDGYNSTTDSTGADFFEGNENGSGGGNGDGGVDGAVQYYHSNGATELEYASDVNANATYALSVSDGLAVSFGDNKSATNRRFSSINLEKWDPDAAYLKELKKVADSDLYSKYLELKKENKNTPSFFLDVADLFIEKGKKDLGLRILSNIAELELESHELLRVLAHRLEQLGYYELAISVYEDVLEIRKEEPQSYRDLGLCLAKNKQYQEAIEMLYQVVDKAWDNRFPGIETIVLIEINNIISLHKKELDITFINDHFIKELPVDVRVILNWDADNCDMDLWITDPRGEKCFYSHKDTKIGGKISNDFTGGYGPEMFNIKNAMVGKYKVQVDYYGTRSQRVSGPTTIQIQLVTDYGKPTEKVKEITRRLSTAKEVLNIGDLFFE